MSMPLKDRQNSLTTSINALALLLGFCVLACSVSLQAGCSRRHQISRGEQRISSEAAAASQTAIRQAEDAVRSGDIAAALAEFERAISINPELTEAHMGIADIYRMQRDYVRAEVRYARAAELEPSNFDAQFYHGLMLHLLDRLSDAVQAYLRALRLNPRDFRANLNLSTAYFQLDENALALDYGRRAVAVDPENGPARFNLGAVYAALGRHRDAVAEYQQAAELMDLTPELLIYLAESLGQLQRYEEMRNTLTQVAQTSPSVTVHERLGFATYKLDDVEGAETHFEAALALDPDYYPAINGLGVCMLNRWLTSGRTDEAARARGVTLLRRSIQINPNQPQIVDLLARYGR